MRGNMGAKCGCVESKIDPGAPDSCASSPAMNFVCITWGPNHVKRKVSRNDQGRSKVDMGFDYALM
jgi:hypothetical protein